MFTEDTVVDPKESEWFGTYADNTHELIYMNQTALYTEDWIGIKSLDEAGKITYVPIVGNHLQFTYEQIDEFVIPILMD
jgi:palmitoyl-protein thioesterase